MYVTSETIYVWGRANFSAVVEVVEVVEWRVIPGKPRVYLGNTRYFADFSDVCLILPQKSW